MNRLICAFYFSLSLVLAGPACGPKPEQLSVPEEKIARIMADLYIAESATTGLMGFSKDSLLRIYNEQVFQIHGVSQAEYEKNLKLLARDENDMERVVKMSVQLVKTDKDEPEPEKQNYED